MVIMGERIMNFSLAHDPERRAIGQAPFLIEEFVVVQARRFHHGMGSMNNGYGRVGQKTVPNFHGIASNNGIDIADVI